MSAAPTPSRPDTVAGRRILVTGGDGLIGRAVVALLAELGARVTVYDCAPPPFGLPNRQT